MLQKHYGKLSPEKLRLVTGETRKTGVDTAKVMAAQGYSVSLEYIAVPHVEVEMLYGIRPDLLRQMKHAGYQTRLYLTYGTEWYLYLCHRLAEYPPNVYWALADCVQPSRTEQPTSDYF